MGNVAGRIDASVLARGSSSLLRISEITEENSFGDLINCPKCGFNCSHLGDVDRRPGNDNYEAEGFTGRGDVIATELHGECGHSWEICLGFHKGEVSIFARLTDGARNPWSDPLD